MKRIKTLLLALSLNLPVSALEGGYDYKELLKEGGTFFKDSDNQYIQYAKVLGRAHWQAAHVAGEGDSENYVQMRRSRIGVETQFLDHFLFQGNINLDTGGINNVKQGWYSQMHDVFLTTDLKGLANISYFDALSLTVGRIKINTSEEVRTSSKKILTVERSAMTDILRPENTTGFNVIAEKDGVISEIGFYANSKVDEFDLWTRGGNGSFVYGSISGEVFDGRLTLDMTYSTKDMNDVPNGASKTQWGGSLYFEQSYGKTDVAYSLYLGDNGDLDNTDRSGLFYGAGILANTALTEKLELVGRAYYWASAEDEGVKINSRYSTQDILNRYGNSHGSLYAGLNYYFIGHNSKIMTGVEWETLNTKNGREDATTLWSGYRMYF